MTYTFEWIPGKALHRNRDGMIYQIEYKVICRQGDQKTSCNKIVRLAESDNPTPLEEVTSDQVIEWIKNKLGPNGVAEIEDFLKAEMTSKSKKSYSSRSFSSISKQDPTEKANDD